VADHAGNWLYDEVVNRAFAQAQHAIADAGSQPELLEKARRQTEIVLHGFFGALGWTVNIGGPIKPFARLSRNRPSRHS